MQRTERKLKVLFLCTGNSCRSQMAEGFGRALAPEGVAIYSGGTFAAGGVHRLAAEVMAFCMEAPNAPVEQSMAVERRLAAALVDPDAHAHAHEGGCCGGHDHAHPGEEADAGGGLAPRS